MKNKTTTKKNIVFLHGWGGSIAEWECVASFFEERGFRCMRLKLPGFDLPEPLPIWGIPEYAEFVINELKKRVGEEKYYFVGHSFGGRLAIYLSAHRPELVEQLVLTNAAGLRIDLPKGKSIIVLLSRIARTIEHMAGFLQIMSWLRKKTVAIIGSKDYQKASPIMREVLKRVVDFDLSFCLPKISCRTLIMWGESDTTTPPAMAELLRKGIRGSSLYVIRGAGHKPHMTHTEEWCTRVFSFLNN